jgi:ABC transporter substrate binding protein (PQQ-dependent alcohol dehydrogenase system)
MMLIRLTLSCYCFALGMSAAMAQSPAPAPDAQKIGIGYLRVETEEILPLSRIDTPPEDDGRAGAQLGIRDNQTTGRFTKQDFTLTEEKAANEEEALAALDKLLAADIRMIVVDAPAAIQPKLADRAAAKDALIFNTNATDDGLRAENCRANLFHTAPSRAQLADALGQYMAWKKWRRWFLISGVHPDDKAFADALRRAAKRFGQQIVEERQYQDAGGSRRTDTGHEQVQQQMPVFTQRAAEHDVIVVADESEVFGGYLPYRTWDARPVIGTSGLVPGTWHPAHEQWGGTQLQSRFERAAKRRMTSRDYQAWMAVRVIGEAVIRTKSIDAKALRQHILGPEFGLGAFKGQAVTFRSWDRQLRQPILLTTLQMVVTVSPQQGFLHQKFETDTLGVDEPESKCAARG